MLEALMKERSKAVANLSIPSPSSMKSRQNSPRMSPASIRANHSLARPSLSRRSSITSETESDASQPDTFETISLLKDDEEAARLDAMVRHVIDMGSSPPADVRESSSSPRHLTSSNLRLVGGHPVFKRRGSCSLDSGSSISLSDTASVTSEQESTSSTTNQTEDESRRMSRLRIRRGTICMGSLSAMMASAQGESIIRSSSSSPCPFQNLKQRSNVDIEEEVEEEIQEKFMQRKSQLLMQAAQESVHMPPAGRNTKARAIAKTTNARLQKTMGNLTMERTTAELLTMTAAMNAAERRRDFGGIQKSKSLDCE
ncbi:uncharacterized protein LOC115929498 [Strongylocentrotus purpuratus]|uniref:Uncharacterized protein n=1 Tax=Strongylocentrotus purpuratus TaxID=7668 RepID=A0A7M7PPN5_STRPU|nr:uncharacterized protein LOC115929498 [Strongylocentrotus purpuratus]